MGRTCEVELVEVVVDTEPFDVQQPARVSELKERDARVSELGGRELRTAPAKVSELPAPARVSQLGKRDNSEIRERERA